VIRLLLDQGLPRSTVQGLADQGTDGCHVADIGYSRATDEEIAALALEQGRVIVTLDSDFHRLLAISGASGPSVIRNRTRRLARPGGSDLDRADFGADRRTDRSRRYGDGDRAVSPIAPSASAPSHIQVPPRLKRFRATSACDGTAAGRNPSGT